MNRPSHRSQPSIKTLIDQTMQETAHRYRCSLQDLRLVGRPELMYALILAEEMPIMYVEASGSRDEYRSDMLCTFIITSIIEERDIDNGGRSSDLLVIHRDDVKLVIDAERL